MNKVLSQFRRLYDDKGLNDVNFEDQEDRLRQSNSRLVKATDALLKASERLNTAAIRAFVSPSDHSH